jgi:energy-coupling factor transporter ATP-binding protein EcfA2
MARTFEDKPATREKVPLLVGLMGPSGGGKTFSALRLATGITRVSGGDIFIVDTEARRALHYADRFNFRHVPFTPPFGPLDYLAAIEHCAKKGAGVIIVDSMSHEHEGPGGVLEMHQAEVERLSRGDARKAEGVKMLAWSKPKAERRRLINTILQFPCNFIFCFRAKEKVKLATKAERAAGEDSVKPLGFMPIAGEEFVFEMTVNCLLLPGAGGVPTWQSDEMGERMMIKLPTQFRPLLTQSGAPLSEEMGEEMARWAAGDNVGPFAQTLEVINSATNPGALEALVPRLRDLKDKRLVPPAEYKTLREAFAARKQSLETIETGQEYDDTDDIERAAIAEAGA